jgi:hypothetical protein
MLVRSKYALEIDARYGTTEDDEDELVYGFLPSNIYNGLLKDDWRVRTESIERVRSFL